MGIALLPGTGRPANDSLRFARQAVARSKKDGGATVTTCSIRQFAEAKGRDELARALPGAIAGGQVIPYYQPVVSLRDGTITGMEVLARWAHPKLGMVEPASFIGIAEERGLCSAITRSLLLQARNDASLWPESWTFAFNTSPNELPAVLDIIAAPSETRLAILTPSRIELEVTETAMMRDVDLARRTVSAMQPFGVKVVLDDFGAGYANFKQLSQVPFSRLKIDKSFITDMLDDPRAEACVQGIVDLAHRLGMTATAEGVECVAVANRLMAAGCDHAQGYFFGRPMPGAQIARTAAMRQEAGIGGVHYAA